MGFAGTDEGGTSMLFLKKLARTPLTEAGLAGRLDVPDSDDPKAAFRATGEDGADLDF